ncbi:hypothetical protein Lal_00027916 [Lupinus albus]|nr:hypothetical protein Lal_00027916 [Lupinus albus]
MSFHGFSHFEKGPNIPKTSFKEKKRVRIKSFTSSQALRSDALNQARDSRSSENLTVSTGSKMPFLAQAGQFLLRRDHSCSSETILAQARILQYSPGFHYPSVVLAMGAILDPWVKLETLNYCFERVDDFTFETKLQLVKKKLYILFEQYCSTNASTSMQILTSDAPQKKAKFQDLGNVFVYSYTHP